jgi:hypothetical protein
MESGAWGYNRATLFLGDINTETWSSSLGAGCEIQRIDNWMILFKTKFRQNFLRKAISKNGCFTKDDVYNIM